MNWMELLQEAETRKTAEDKLQGIRSALMDCQSRDVGLLGGAPGIALFWFYLSRARSDDTAADLGMACIEAASQTVEEGFGHPAFSSGLAGLGWTITHLVQNGFFDADLGDVLADLTEPLHQAMLAYMRQGEYDYLHGALGIALYFLSRGDLPEQKAILCDLILELRRAAESDGRGGLRWPTLLNRETGLRGYNLSLSHGQASIIEIVSRITAQGLGGDPAKDLLDGAVRYLLSHEHADPQPGQAFFPSWVCDDPSETHRGGRVAWCYGDLGLGGILVQAGKRMNESGWQQKGLTLMRNTLLRREPAETGVVDAGLCHGAAGLAHIYNRQWQQTGDEAFALAARHWLDQTLKLAVHADGPAGYKAFRTPQHGGWTVEMGLLEGVAGIGLALISAMYPIEPAWDSLLLLS